MEKNSYLEKLGELSSSFKDTGIKSGLTYGQILCLRNYQDCLRHNSSAFEITELPGDTYLEEFMVTLIMADVYSFVITAKDTAVIEFLHLIKKRGWKITSLEVVNRKDTGCFGVYDYDVPGLRVSLNSM